jgi:hypothetical protein
MKHTTKICAALVAACVIAAPTGASAECYADYKAKQTAGDLRLHYGVVKVPDRACGDKQAIAKNVKSRISGEGWQLLRVMSSFDETGLSSRQADAGEYFLRY